MARSGVRICGIVCFVGAVLVMWSAPGGAISLDKDGDIKLGVRTYVNARIGTQETSRSESLTTKTETFPFSPAGHLRQNRAFIEAEYNQNLDRLLKQGVGPFSLLNSLPFKIKDLAIHLTFRGEFDGLYDWGPREYSTADQYPSLPSNPVPATNSKGAYGMHMDGTMNDPCPFSPADPACKRLVDIPDARRHLRALGTHRERLFQAYLETSVGDLFIRFGRQILSWGETDGFRLLDQINPVDSSFGGFLISLDERRVPLDMLRLQYFVGGMGPVSEAYIEMYAAIDDKVGFAPGTPAGSPWTLPNLGAPSATTKTILVTPKRTIGDTRGGGQIKWNMFDATFGVAHYYTYFDIPALQVYVEPNFPAKGSDSIGNVTFPDGFSAYAIQSAPLVQVTGVTTTFALPSIFSVVRSEFAYFKGEPRFRQSRIDPFTFHYYDENLKRLPSAQRDLIGRTTGGRELGNSVNWVIGLDSNLWVRFLNPNQTFFISTQFFFKHLFDATEGQVIKGASVSEGEVLPVPAQVLAVTGLPGKVEPDFIRNPADQFLQTLFITTSYRSGTISPSFGFFYDWGGALVYQPSVTFSHDPFRLTIDYSILDAGGLKGGSGVSLLRDRDNIQFRFEYVI